MKGRNIIVFLLGASAIAGGVSLLIARVVRCHEFVDPPLRSPDGESVAVSTMKACPTGLLSTTTYSVFVTLGSKSPVSSALNQTMIFDEFDAAEPPTMIWVSGHELTLRVNDEGEVRISKPEVGGIKIRYTVPRWIWDSLGSIDSNRLSSKRESEGLFRDGKLNKDDLRASLEIDDAVAKERSEFRQWVMNNATVEDSAH